MANSRLYAFLLGRAWLAFLLLGVSFVLGGLLTLNLLSMLAANFQFLAAHGVDAVRHGGLRQLLEVAASGYVAAAFYLLFRVCEKALVERLSVARPVEAAVAARSPLPEAAQTSENRRRPRTRRKRKAKREDSDPAG